MRVFSCFVLEQKGFLNTERCQNAAVCSAVPVISIDPLGGPNLTLTDCMHADLGCHSSPTKTSGRTLSLSSYCAVVRGSRPCFLPSRLCLWMASESPSSRVRCYVDLLLTRNKGLFSYLQQLPVYSSTALSE